MNYTTWKLNPQPHGLLIHVSLVCSEGAAARGLFAGWWWWWARGGRVQLVGLFGLINVQKVI